MRDYLNGKLIIRTFIHTHKPDQHGRVGGRWVTLFTKHGVDENEADAAAAAFKECNPQISNTFGTLYCTWVAYEQHITI